MHAAAVIGATPVSWRSILSNRQGGSRHRGACCAGLGCRLYGVTGVRKIGGENGMVVQPVHESLPRGRVRGGFAFSRRGPSRFFCSLAVSLFRDCLSSDRSNSGAVWRLQWRSESEIAAVMQLAETSWTVRRQNTSVGANPGNGCTAASNAVSASSHLTVGEKRKAPRLTAFAAG